MGNGVGDLEVSAVRARPQIPTSVLSPTGRGPRRSAPTPGSKTKCTNALDPQENHRDVNLEGAMDRDVRSAVSMSHLNELPPDVLDGIMSSAARVKIPTGSVTHREGDNAPHLELVISGVVRVFVAAEDGRTMTIRYCRPGALIGALSLFSAEFAMPATTQALVDAELLKFSPTVVCQAAERDWRIARVFLRELSERARSFIYEIPGGAFATVRQRVGRHLLDLASERGPEHPSQHRRQELIVRVSQQELADAVGTVREVVVRVLRALREDGVVRTERGRIVIIDPSRLIQEQGWNTSS